MGPVEGLILHDHPAPLLKDSTMNASNQTENEWQWTAKEDKRREKKRRA